MKRFFLSGLAIAACFGLANTASAQYGSNYQYSSYGYGYQEPAQDAAQQAMPSPSDLPTPVQPGATPAYSAPAQPAPPTNQVVPGSNCAPNSTYGAPGQVYHPAPQNFQSQPSSVVSGGCSGGAPAAFGNGAVAGQAAGGCGTGAYGSGAGYNGGYAAGGSYFGTGAAGCGGAGYGGYAGTYGGYTGGAACGTGYGGSGLGAGVGLGAAGAGLVRSADRNVVLGVRGLMFERDYEDDRGLGTNAAGRDYFTTDATHNFFAGFEATLGVRNCTGSGWEATYWGLFPDQADVEILGGPFASAFPGAVAVDLNGFDLYDIWNTSTSWRLYRETEMHNLELHFLRNAGSSTGLFGGTTNVEWLAGARWFSFDEAMRFSANNFTAGYPALTLYDLNVQNNMVGMQLGARFERCLGSKATLALGTKFGVYNNHIYARQQIVDGNTGAYATVPTGPVDYNFASRKDDLATLGELDFGLNVNLSCSLRANIGYRLMGVSGIGLAADQIPYNFNDTQEIQRIKSNGSLLLHGFYFGLEKCF